MALTRQDPLGGYNFAVELDGLTRAGFKTCSGLETTTAATKYREGTDPTLAPRELPGMLSFSTIKLARGITTDRALSDWRDIVASGQPNRKNISVILRDDAGVEQVRWNILNCWPTKWTGPTLDAGADATAIETLELAHEGIEVHKWG